MRDRSYRPGSNRLAQKALRMSLASRALLPHDQGDAENLTALRALLTPELPGTSSWQQIAARGLFGLETILRSEKNNHFPTAPQHQRTIPETTQQAARRLLDEAAGRRVKAEGLLHMEEPDEPFADLDDDLDAEAGALPKACPSPGSKQTKKQIAARRADFRIAVVLDADAFVECHQIAIRRQSTMSEVLSKFVAKQLETNPLEQK